MTKTHNQTSSAEGGGKAVFVEPAISEPVEVVNGNPAAGALFAIAGSGYTGIDGGTNPGGDGGPSD